MAKRKAPVNDIIYELDNDDITLSSEDETTLPKRSVIQRTEMMNSPIRIKSDSNSQDSATEVITIDSSFDIINIDAQSPPIKNGGKILENLVIVEDDIGKASSDDNISTIVHENIDGGETMEEDIVLVEDSFDDKASPECTSRKVVSVIKHSSDDNKTTILHENTDGGKSQEEDLIFIEDDINLASPECSSFRIVQDTKHGANANKAEIFYENVDLDSPGNSDLGVVGCENRTPLVTVRFKDSKLAINYKKKLKAFMLSLIKLHETENLDSDNETDLELDIWPEDLQENLPEQESEDNSFFFVDTAPCEVREFIPAYNSLKV